MMKPFVYICVLSLLIAPVLVHAQSFRELVNEQVVPFGDSIIALGYGFAFLFFLWGMFRFFFSTSDEQREKGKSFAFWGIIGLVVLFGVWGFVKLFLSILPSAGS